LKSACRSTPSSREYANYSSLEATSSAVLDTVPRQNRLLSFSRLRPALENPGGLPVRLTIPQMKKVVEREGGCIVWGGSVNLSPADDIL
jgi:hypothetical protein